MPFDNIGNVQHNQQPNHSSANNQNTLTIAPFSLHPQQIKRMILILYFKFRIPSYSRLIIRHSILNVFHSTSNGGIVFVDILNWMDSSCGTALGLAGAVAGRGAASASLNVVVGVAPR